MSSVNGVVFATAMAAVSGTAVVFLALKLNKKPLFPPSPAAPPRPCLSSGVRKGEKKKKKVRFAADVVEPSANNEAFRKRMNSQIQTKGTVAAATMPANRAALYNGIIRDRVIHRMGYSY